MIHDTHDYDDEGEWCPLLVAGVLESLLQPEERKGSVGQEVKILSQNQPKIIQRLNYLFEMIMIPIMLMH